MSNILFISAEAVPFAKVGGMADVVGSLPQSLRQHGLDTRVLLPGYGRIEHFKYNINHLFSYEFNHRMGSATVQVYSTIHEGVPYYFLQSWPYFGDEQSVYTEFQWDMPRFIHFNQAAMAFMWELNQRIGWLPDMVHVHDWHTGLIPFLVDYMREDPTWAQMASMMTIHNLAYQGDYAGGFLFEAGIPGRHQPDLVYQDLTNNLLAISIAYSDIITTVSPRYAREIQYPYMGYGLHNLINQRKEDLYGILNGVDTVQWDPAIDTYIQSNFDHNNFREKRWPNKSALQRYVSLPERGDVPLVGIVSRMVWQKGIDLLVPALRRLMQEGYDFQFVALGTGETAYENDMWYLGEEFRDQGVRVRLQYDDYIAKHIYAGGDIFLMPSHFEPCGIGQMLAMRYGALPLVRETGGLADTVQNYDNGDGHRGTGFVFSWEEPGAVYNTLRWAMDTYWNRRDAWQRMQERAMRYDYSWNSSAQHYANLYEKAINQRRSE